LTAKKELRVYSPKSNPGQTTKPATVSAHGAIPSWRCVWSGKN